MKKVYSASGMKLLEKNTIDNIGINELVLMERAALSTDDYIRYLFKSRCIKALIVCGTGNNGADGLSLARLLLERGCKVEVYISYGHSETKAFRIQRSICEKLGIDFIGDVNIETQYDICVDALLGIGLHGNIDGESQRIINLINKIDAHKISMDIPSGINASDGRSMGAYVRADASVTYGAYKNGFFFHDGIESSRLVVCDRIGIADYAEADYDYLLAEAGDFADYLPKRKEDTNKGSFGKVLLICGNEDLTGCTYLAAKAALTSGAGMVKVITHQNNRDYILNALPEAMLSVYKDIVGDISEDINWCDSIVIGPGIGTGDNAKELLRQALLSSKPLVVDADAINVLAVSNECLDMFVERSKDFITVVTPHKKEKERLFTEMKYRGLMQDTSEADFYNITGAILVDKGKYTKVYGEEFYINPSGNNGLSTAGSGDVLSGIIGALLGMHNKMGLKQTVTQTVLLGVYLHGLCADIFAKKNAAQAMLASDIIGNIGNAIKVIAYKGDN